MPSLHKTTARSDAANPAQGEDLSPPGGRRLVQTRNIDIQVFKRDDGLWDAEVELNDRKTRDFDLASCRRPAGAPIHQLWLRVSVDGDFNIVDAQARTTAAPYDQHCAEANAAYRGLVGLNLLRGFAQEVKARLGGVAGCTHLTELTRVLPTAVVQAFAGEVESWQNDPQQQPFQLDRCQALRLDGPVVLRYYPRWARRPA